MELNNINLSIGSRIKRLRKSNGFTQNTVADFLGLDRGSYSKFETGTRIPQIDYLIKLSQYYNISLDYIILGRENKVEEKINWLLYMQSDASKEKIYEVIKVLIKQYYPK